MRYLRSPRMQRGLFALMGLSLLPLLVGPLAYAGGAAAPSRYADWLRLALPAPEGSAAVEAYDQALEAASSAEAPSLGAFVGAFVEALYDIEAGAELDGLARRSEAALRGLLQRQAMGFGATTPWLRLTWVTQAGSVSAASSYPTPPWALVSGSSAPFLAALFVPLAHAPGADVVLPLRWLCAAQPLGP